MAPMLFTFQIILLVIGLGVGYLFLVKSNAQDSRLKNIGEIIGWALIAATVFLAICNFFYSITILNKYTDKQYCPINSTNEAQQQSIQEGNVPGLPVDTGKIQENEKPQEDEGTPIKRDPIHDHD